MSGVATTAFAQTLSAPSLAATSGVTLAGQTFGERTDTGVLTGQPSGAAVVPSLGTYTVQVAPGSAMLLTF
jgi:hypothetical protein